MSAGRRLILLTVIGLLPVSAKTAGFTDETSRLFTGSSVCSDCHDGMKDASGREFSFAKDWQASLHAHAGRDPYWKASVRAEVSRHPELRGIIEDKCASCHMPMARIEEHEAGHKMPLLDTGYLSLPAPLRSLGEDGVSCAVCHQMTAPDSSGPRLEGGTIPMERSAPLPGRVVYGPFAPEPNADAIMEAGSGFRSVQSGHLASPEVCASCHTLRIPFVDTSGAIAGTFPEQMVVEEWKMSSFARSGTCLGCHMPEAPAPVSLSSLGDAPRSPVKRHTFRGGNSFMQRIFALFGEALGIPTASAEMENAAAATREFLGIRAARIELEDLAFESGTILGTIEVTNLAGHKLPSAFPSRRVWIRITVTAKDGTVLFSSGAVRPDGFIEGNDNDRDSRFFEPHRDVIRSGAEVQIYEAIPGDAGGQPTTGLMRSAFYLKDNRLLPEGFPRETTNEEVRVCGGATADRNFTGGTDRVKIEIPLSSLSCEGIRVTADLLYQTIGYRWAENLRPAPGDEPADFLKMYAAAGNLGEILASDSAHLE